MTVIQISPPKALAELGMTAPIVYDTEKGNDGGYVYLLKQGLRYLASARASHEFAKIRGTQDDPTGVEPTEADAQRVIDRLLTDLHAPEWPERERAERETVDLPTRVWLDLLTPRFDKAGVLVKGRTARAATPETVDAEGKRVPAKPAREAREAVTVQTLIAKHGGVEAAYRAVNEQFIRGLYERKGTPVDEQSMQARINDGWAKLQAEHAKELKARQRAASKLEDADSAVL